MEDADVRVCQGRNCLRLALESLLEFRIIADVLREDFESDRTV